MKVALVSSVVLLPFALTWVCCCKGDAILGVERGLVLGEEGKLDEKGTPAAERVQHRRHWPWSSLDRCLEWRCWQVRRRGPDPSHSIATPQVSGASAWRPWRGRIGKTPVSCFKRVKKEKGRRCRRSTPAAGSIQEDSFYSLDQFIHMCFTPFLPRVFQDGTCQLGIHNTFSRLHSATALPHACKVVKPSAVWQRRWDLCPPDSWTECSWGHSGQTAEH